MTRIFGDFAYGAGPRTGCFWDRFATEVPQVRPALRGELRADVCIIGAGFTGLQIALKCGGVLGGGWRGGALGFGLLGCCGINRHRAILSERWVMARVSLRLGGACNLEWDRSGG